MKMLRYCLAVLFATLVFNPAYSQSPPFNAYSIASLGGNCAMQGSFPYQTANNVTLCTPAGSPGQVFRLSAGGVPEWFTTPGTGTVTSVGIALPSFFTVTGSPITTSGTLSASMSTQPAKTFLASPSGSSGAPTFRSITSTDIDALSPLSPVRVQTAAGNVTAATTDKYIIINKTVSQVTTVTLPASPGTGREMYIKDAKGDAMMFPITVDGNGSTIDGLATYNIIVGGTSLRLVFDGTAWRII